MIFNLFYIISFILSIVSAEVINSSGLQEYSGQVVVSGVICILGGIVLLFFGYRILKPVLFIVGFYIFTIIGFILLTRFEPSGGYENRESVLLFGSLAIGLLGAFLSMFFFRVGIFLLGAFAGLSLAMFILSFKNGGLITSETGRSIFMGIFALAGGIIINFYEKELIIICSSFGGSYSIVYGVDTFAQTGFTDAARMFLNGGRIDAYKEFKTNGNVIGLLVTVVVLFIAGMFVQFRMNRGVNRHSYSRTKD